MNIASSPIVNVIFEIRSKKFLVFFKEIEVEIEVVENFCLNTLIITINLYRIDALLLFSSAIAVLF